MNVINNGINKLDKRIIKKKSILNTIHDKHELDEAMEEITELEIIRELVIKYEKSMMSVSN